MKLLGALDRGVDPRVQLASGDQSNRTNSGGVTEGGVAVKVGNGSDTHGIGSGYHLLPHFNSNTNTDSNIFKYEYKTDVSDSDFYSDIYSSQLKIYIVKFNIH